MALFSHPCISWSSRGPVCLLCPFCAASLSVLGLTTGMRVRDCYSLIALAQIQLCIEMGQFLFISLFMSVAFSCSHCAWLPMATPVGSEQGNVALDL